MKRIFFSLLKLGWFSFDFFYFNFFSRKCGAVGLLFILGDFFCRRVEKYERNPMLGVLGMEGGREVD